MSHQIKVYDAAGKLVKTLPSKTIRKAKTGGHSRRPRFNPDRETLNQALTKQGIRRQAEIEKVKTGKPLSAHDLTKAKIPAYKLSSKKSKVKLFDSWGFEVSPKINLRTMLKHRKV